MLNTNIPLYRRVSKGIEGFRRVRIRTKNFLEIVLGFMEGQTKWDYILYSIACGRPELTSNNKKLPSTEYLSPQLKHDHVHVHINIHVHTRLSCDPHIPYPPPPPLLSPVTDCGPQTGLWPLHHPVLWRGMLWPAALWNTHSGRLPLTRTRIKGATNQ